VTQPGVEYWSGHQHGWRYLAYRVDGLGGPGVVLDTELPLQGVTLTDVLSGPTQMQATIAPRVARMMGSDGLPLLRPWDTAIFAEQDGIIRAGGLLVASGYSGPEWSLDVSGFTTIAHGTGYEGDTSFVQTDPLDIARHIWAHLQAQVGTNLGLVVDAATRSPVRVGTALAAGATAASSEDGPYRLARWQNDDLGGDLDDLAGSTPFDYHERHEWNGDKTQVLHYLDFGYPRIGARQPDLRFVLGENVQTIPDIEDDGEDFANDVRVLGAGEGSSMIIGRATTYTGGVRRMATVERKDLTTKAAADLAARQEVARRALMTNVGSVVVRSTPETPLGAWGVGDEIRLQVDAGDGGWRAVDLWFRVVSMTISPESPELIGMNLLRADLVV
jgi:hypothetical protein